MEKASVPAPKCLALILCEQVIQDVQTKNLTLVNTFNTIATSSPRGGTVRYPRLAVFVSLTNGRGLGHGKLIIADPEGQEVFHGEGPVVFADPLAVVEITFDIRQLPLTGQGEYRIDFWCNGDLVNQRCFRVQIASAAPGAGGEG
jgi:hypothetical protein